MAPALLTCREFVELVTDYVEDRLAPADRRRFDEHMELCPGCGLYVDQMRRTIALTGTLREDDVEPDARAVLLARFRTWNQVQ